MRAFPEELGKLGFVFNFITYGGHQIDGLAGEEFASALRQDGMLALARLQRKFRLLESPYRTPQTLVGGPRADAALMSLSGRTATTKAMGKGSTQFQHLVQTEVPPKLPRGVAGALVRPRRVAGWTEGLAPAAHRRLRPARARHSLARRREDPQRRLHDHQGPARPQHPLGARPEHLRPGPAQEAPDDPGPPVPDPPLQGRLGPLPHARPTTTSARQTA